METTELFVEERVPYEVDISDNQPITFTEDQYISVVISHDVDTYDGEYEVTPRPTQQTLETENRLMERNVSVLGIPYIMASNESGGYTVSIAS